MRTIHIRTILLTSLSAILLPAEISAFAAEEATPPVSTQSGASTAGLKLLAGLKTALRKGDKLAFFGDSITMQGGYVQLIQSSLKESPVTKELLRSNSTTATRRSTPASKRLPHRATKIPLTPIPVSI